MGYSHVWGYKEEPISEENWAKIKEDVTKLTAASPVPLSSNKLTADGGYIITDGPTINDRYIAFEGVSPDSCENLMLFRDFKAARPKWPTMFGTSIDGCKTEHLPYDLVVAACLAVASPYLEFVGYEGSLDPEDEEYNEWPDAVAWASKVLGRPISVNFRDNAAWEKIMEEAEKEKSKEQ